MNPSYKPVLADWLAALVGAADILSRPTLNNVLAGGDTREFHRRFRRQLLYAEQQGLLRREGRAASLVYCLTAQGRLAALGGRDPEERWGRDWDGRWRLMLFDLPANRRRLRQRLLRWLHQHHFGFLQNSAWIHPDPLSELAEALAEYRDDVEALTLLEAGCCAGYSNTALVRGAWDFDEINKRYTAYLKDFGRRQALAIKSGRGSLGWASRWLRAERVAWNHALELDPLLPRALLPPGYRGVEAWQARRRVVRALIAAIGRGK